MFGTNGKILSQRIHMIYTNQSSSTHCSKVSGKVNVFKNKSTSKVKVTESKTLVFMERSCHNNIKHESSSTHFSKFIRKVKTNITFQGQGHRVKYIGIQVKFLSQGILMFNIKALALMVEKLLARFKFQTVNRVNC